MRSFKFTKQEEATIVKAIQEAEKLTSGEIRVHISKKSTENHFQVAEKVFYALKMDGTVNRNGVLFFVSQKDKVFTIIGDKGINDIVADDFWEGVKDLVIDKFKKREFVNGLVEGIKTVGIILKDYFPYQENDTNELPDEISKD